MIQVVTFVTMVVLYVIPLNIVLFKNLEKFVDILIERYLIYGETVLEIFPLAYIYILFISIIKLIVISIMYIISVALIFLFVYLILNIIVRKLLYIYKDIDIDEYINYLKRFNFGQKRSDKIITFFIVLLLVLQCFYLVIDVKILVFGGLLIFFMFRGWKAENISS